MPRGMDERFEDPSDEATEEDAATEAETAEPSAAVEANGRDTGAATGHESDEEKVDLQHRSEVPPCSSITGRAIYRLPPCRFAGALSG